MVVLAYETWRAWPLWSGNLGTSLSSLSLGPEPQYGDKVAQSWSKILNLCTLFNIFLHKMFFRGIRALNGHRLHAGAGYIDIFQQMADSLWFKNVFIWNVCVCKGVLKIRTARKKAFIESLPKEYSYSTNVNISQDSTMMERPLEKPLQVLCTVSKKLCLLLTLRPRVFVCVCVWGDWKRGNGKCGTVEKWHWKMRDAK